MWVLQQKTQNKTRRLIRLNFNETEVSSLYKFMTILKSEVYINDFFFQKYFLAKV